MNTLLWTLQIFLGVLFLFHGIMLVAQPASMRGTLEALPYPKGFFQFISVCEVLGGLGLMLPWWLGIAPALTPVAAAGLSGIMLGALVTHLRGDELPQVAAIGTLTVLLLVVASFRWDGLA